MVPVTPLNFLFVAEAWLFNVELLRKTPNVISLQILVPFPSTVTRLVVVFEWTVLDIRALKLLPSSIP